MIVFNSVVVSLMYACMFPILRSESNKKSLKQKELLRIDTFALFLNE